MIWLPKYCRSTRFEPDEFKQVLGSKTVLGPKIGIGGNRCKSISRIDRFYQSERTFAGFGLPPTTVEAKAPAAAARASAASISAPARRAARKAATKASPAPVVS